MLTLIFRVGGYELSGRESTGNIDLTQQPRPEAVRVAVATPADAARAMINFNRMYWKLVLQMYGWGRTA